MMFKIMCSGLIAATSENKLAFQACLVRHGLLRASQRKEVAQGETKCKSFADKTGLRSKSWLSWRKSLM